MLDFLRQEGVGEALIARIEQFRRDYPAAEGDAIRIPAPRIKYFGSEIWKLAITAILSGENLLLVGPKATGKNVFAENLSAVFGRPEWDVSFYLNTAADAGFSLTHTEEPRTYDGITKNDDLPLFFFADFHK